jgi:hypothetical protein
MFKYNIHANSEMMMMVITEVIKVETIKIMHAIHNNYLLVQAYDVKYGSIY